MDGASRALADPYAAVAAPAAAGERASSGGGTWLPVLLWIGVGLLGLVVAGLLVLGARRLLAAWRLRAARNRVPDDEDDPFWQPPARDEATARL